MTTLAARALWVDHARAIGIMLIVYGHVMRGLDSAGIALPDTAYLFVDRLLYSFHTQLFFFLSGLFFYSGLARYGARRYALGKLDTILYPYLLWSLLHGAIEVLFSEYTNGSVTMPEVLAHLAVPRQHFWFLYALFLVMLSATLLQGLVRNRLALCVLAALAFLFAGSLPGHPAVQHTARAMVYFVAGAAIADRLAAPRREPGWLLSVAVLSLVVLQLLPDFGLNGAGFIDRLQSLLLAFVGISVVVLAARLLAARWTLPALAALGEASLSIYILHVLFASGTRIVLQQGFGIANWPLHLFAGLLAGLLLPFVVHRLVADGHLPFVFSAPLSRLLAWNRGREGRRK